MSAVPARAVAALTLVSSLGKGQSGAPGETAASSTTAYAGTVTTVTDQAGKSRRQIVYALGRVARVYEPDASGALGSVDAPNQATYYEYDTLDNLTAILQTYPMVVTQTRKFKRSNYDSLDRFETAIESIAVTPWRSSKYQNSPTAGLATACAHGARAQPDHPRQIGRNSIRSITRPAVSSTALPESSIHVNPLTGKARFIRFGSSNTQLWANNCGFANNFSKYVTY